MTKRRATALLGFLLLAVAGVAAALLLTNRREVTTSSDAAYKVWREAIENERRFYFKEARAGFAKALELDPDFAAAMLGLARQSKKEQALALVHRAERLKNRLTERERLHVDLAVASLEKGPSDRLKVAREILARYPDDFRATSVVAMDYAMKGKMEDAVRVFTTLLEADPNSAEAYNLIGYYCGYRGEYEKAIENLKKYQFMAPDQANPYDSLGEIQAYSGHYDEAIQNLNRALAIKPDFYAPFDHLGVAYEGKGDYPKAFQNYVKAAEVVPLDSERPYYLWRALRVAIISNDVAAGRTLLPKFERTPSDEHWGIVKPAVDAAYDLLEGRLQEAEKKLAELKPRADEFQRKAMAKRPGFKPYWPEWNWVMARTKIALGKDADAIPLLAEMADPPNPWEKFEGRQMVYEGKAQLAALLAKRGQIDRAEKLLEENKRWNPSWAPTRPAETAVGELRRAQVLASTK